jgi:mannosyltransferase
MTRVHPAPAALLVAAAAAALVLRCWHLSSWPLWLDESWSRWMTEQGWSGLVHAAIGYDTHPPFYYLLLKVWTLVAPSTSAGLRSLSVIASMAMLPIAWAASGRIETLRASPWARALAVALVAVSPPLIVAASQARPYALFSLAFGTALLAALRLLGEERPRISWLVYLTALEATFWLHSLGILFAASLAAGLFLALAVAGTLRRNLVPFLAVHALAGLAWLPGLLILLDQRRHWNAASWLHFSFADVGPGLATGLAVPGAAAFLILALALLGLRAISTSKSGRSAAILLACAAVLPAAATIVLSVVASPVFLSRTLVPSVLPALLLTAAGLASLERKELATIASAALLAWLASVSFFQASAQPEEKWQAFAAWLEPRVAPGEEVWLLPNEIALPFRYGVGPVAYRVRGIPADFPAPHHSGPRPSGTIAVPAMTRADATRLVADAKARGLAGIWVVTRFPWLFDPGSSLPAAFGPDRRDLRDVRFAPLIVDHYRLRPEARPEPAPERR